MVTELFASEGGFWAALLNLLSQGTGGGYLGYFMLVTILIAIGKFSGPAAAIMFAAVAIPILAGIGLLPVWLAAVEVMIVGILVAKNVYDKMVS